HAQYANGPPWLARRSRRDGALSLRPRRTVCDRPNHARERRGVSVQLGDRPHRIEKFADGSLLDIACHEFQEACWAAVRPSLKLDWPCGQVPHELHRDGPATALDIE